MFKASMTPEERRAVANRGGPPPPLPPRPAGPGSLGAAGGVPKSLAAPTSNDPSTVGHFEVSRSDFEGLGTGRTPRHQLPVRPSETAGPVPAPLD